MLLSLTREGAGRVPGILVGGRVLFLAFQVRGFIWFPWLEATRSIVILPGRDSSLTQATFTPTTPGIKVCITPEEKEKSYEI